MPADTPASFRCVTVSPLLIISNTERRIVLAIVDGRRDVTAVMAERLRES